MEESRIKYYIKQATSYPEVLKRIPGVILEKYPQIYLEVFQNNPNSIMYIPKNIREEHPELCIKAVQENYNNIKYISEELQIEHPEICLEAVKREKGLLYYISLDVLDEHPEICIEAVIKDKESLEDIPEEYEEEYESIRFLNLIMQDYENIKTIPEEVLLENMQLCRLIVKYTGSKYIDYIPKSAITPDLVRECLEESEQKYLDYMLPFIQATGNIEFIRECLQKRQKFNNSTVYKLIESLGSKEEIEKIVKENDIFKFDLSSIISFITRTEDPEFIKKFIDKKEEYGFTTKEIITLLINCNDEELLKNQIEKNEHGFSVRDIQSIMHHIADSEYVINYAKTNSIQMEKEQRRIVLPAGMTIGMEIEAEEGRKGRSDVLLLMGEVIDGWKCTLDKSLNDGVEVVSPVLKSEEENEGSIYRVCDILRLCNQCVSERCGGHIHIGANYLTNINAWKNLLEIWANTENILYIIGNAPNDLPRSEIYEYAAPISANIEAALEKGEVDLAEEEDIEHFCEQLTSLQGKPFSRRYSGINFENFGDEDKNTIEFRVSNGTLDPDTWIANINLFGGIVAAAQELSIIQEKIYNGQELTYEEEQKIKAFEKIRNLTNTEKNDIEKLEALMVLAIQGRNHHIYRERYKTNKQAMMYRTIVDDVRPIKIGKKPLGRMAFSGDDRVTGEEYNQAISIIESDLEKRQTRTNHK